MLRKTGPVLLCVLVLALCAACGAPAEDPNEDALEAVLEKVYTVPGEVTIDYAGAGNDADAISALIETRQQELFGGLVDPEYLPEFWLSVAQMFRPTAEQTGGSMQVDTVKIVEKDENTYEYELKVTCADAAGTETTLETSGSARFNGAGLIENMKPHNGRELLKAMGMRVV